MAIPNSSGRDRDNGRATSTATAAATGGVDGVVNILSNQSFRQLNRNVSESDSFPESAYVNPFSPGTSNWGNMNIPKSFSLNVDNNVDWNMDALNLGDERDLAHRLV